jgi:hypothetical protein
MAYSRYLEDHPRISMVTLKQSRFFETGILELSFPRHIVTLQLVRDGSQIQTHVIDESQDWLRDIGLTKKIMTFGERVYFICTTTLKTCDELHFLNLRWRRPAAHRGMIRLKNESVRERRTRKYNEMAARFLGVDGRGPARGKTRLRLAETLTENRSFSDGRVSPFDELAPFWRDSELVACDRQRSTAGTGALSTAEALIEGRTFRSEKLSNRGSVPVRQSGQISCQRKSRGQRTRRLDLSRNMHHWTSELWFRSGPTGRKSGRSA